MRDFVWRVPTLSSLALPIFLVYLNCCIVSFWCPLLLHVAAAQPKTRIAHIARVSVQFITITNIIIIICERALSPCTFGWDVSHHKSTCPLVHLVVLRSH
uniref:Uncharacterized protein n=1 Tax=Trypanosoma vivax (strain Y486) TaxID=1055687 RepID=G0U212_TRYVY|nr:hypothetical protein TVY486_0901380 [Trypanosoma vivax Y486]